MVSQGTKRYALVVGNWKYAQSRAEGGAEGGYADLQGAECDAKRMCDKLERRGFAVGLCMNVTAAGINKRLQAFCVGVRGRSAAHHVRQDDANEITVACDCPSQASSSVIEPHPYEVRQPCSVREHPL